MPVPSLYRGDDEPEVKASSIEIIFFLALLMGLVFFVPCCLFLYLDRLIAGG